MSKKNCDTQKHVTEVSSESNKVVWHKRRELIKVGAAVASSTAIGISSTQSQAASTANEIDPATKLYPQPGDRIQVANGELKDQFVKVDTLVLNAMGVEGFPYDPNANVLRRKNRLNRLLVLRLDPDEMDDATREKSAEGVVVYSALCTHRSCTIKSWMEEERHMRCHCHLSEFAALSEGSVKGGPARKQLPMVPVTVDGEGYIVATDGFTRKPGGAKL
ncbi:MAG: Rieske 2Fe-2S domain-containing protein [Granulosicoccus sp.]